MLGEILRSADNSLACEPFQTAVVQPAHGLPPILLAERGGAHAACHRLGCGVSTLLVNAGFLTLCCCRMLFH